MATRNSQLFSYIQELKQLTTDDLCQDQFFHQIGQELDEITTELGSEKLSIHVLSADLKLANSFCHLLKTSQTLEQNYQVQLYELPKQASAEQKAEPSAFLVLQELAENIESVRQTRYALAEGVLVVGRKPGCGVSIPDYCTRVSGQHLKVHYCPPSDRTSIPEWRVQNCDGCRNGTYLNGEPLKESRILKPGDCLVLGNHALSAKSPQLIFECSSSSEATSMAIDESRQLKKPVNCDVLFLVVNSQDELTEERVSELISISLAVKVFVIILLPESIEVFAATQPIHSPITLESLNQQLASMSEQQSYSIKAQRLLLQILSVVDKIHQLFLGRQEKLELEVKKAEIQQSQERRKDQVEDIPFLIKTINEQKSSLLRAIEASLAQSKQDLLDDSLASSILQKIQDTVDELEAVVIKQRGEKYLELRAKHSESNVNDFILASCESELINWAGEEWRKICEEYGNGGLKGLVESSNHILRTTCEGVSTSTVRIKPQIKLEGAFQASLRRIPNRIEYQEDPIWVYFIKKIRSSVFQVMGILFLLSFLGLSRANVIKSVNKQISNSIFLSILVVGMAIWLIYKLYKGYQKDKEIEIRKASEKVRQELKNYYHKVTKSRFVEKISQSLEGNLKSEINKFDASIKSLIDTASKSSFEARNNPVELRSYLRECQDQTKKLERKSRDVQRVKDKLQRLQSSS